MNYQRILMYFCTFASATWFVLGVVYGVPEAYLCSAGFVVLSFLYWDQEPEQLGDTPRERERFNDEDKP